MGKGELKVGDLVELVKRNPMGFSAYSCKILKVNGSRHFVLSAPSIRGKPVSLPTVGNYQMRYLTNAGHFKIAANIEEKTSNTSIIVEIKGEPQTVMYKEYTKTECDIAVRFTSLFNETLRGTGVLSELSGGGAKLNTPCSISIGDTVRFPLELVGCEDMIVMARVVDVNELENDRLYSLAFTDMHMRYRRQLMDYIESRSLAMPRGLL